MQRDRVEEGVLVSIGLALAALGQAHLVWRRRYVWDGVLFWAAGLVCLGWAVRRAKVAERGSSRTARPTWWISLMEEEPIRGLILVGGVCLSFTAGWLARQRGSNGGYGDVLVLWAVGLLGFVIGWWRWPGWRERCAWSEALGAIRRWVATHRVPMLGMICLLLAALVLRAYDLEHIPANLGGDEGTQGAAALELIRRPLGNPFTTGWFSVPTMSFLAYGISTQVFGATIGGLRALSALVGTATVLTTFLLARELWSDRVAWIAAAALAFGHFHLHFSRLGSNQIADGMFATLSLWLLVRALRAERTAARSKSVSLEHAAGFALAGASVGLGWYGYFGARLVGFIVASYLVVQMILSHRFLARHGRLLTIMAVAAFVATAPLLLHYTAHPGELTARPSQVSIFASGWLERERVLTGRGTLSLLAEQFWKSISAFNYTLDPTFWYRPMIPLLDVVSGVFFVVGLLWAFAHVRRPSSLLLLIWFWAALILGWVMTENPPSSQRMVIVAPALAIFVALGIDWVIGELKTVTHWRRAVGMGVTAGVVTLIGGLNLGYYFLAYTPTRVYGNPTAEMTTMLARRLNAVEEKHTVYFHGAPYVYWDFGTLGFMVRDRDGVDVPPLGEGERPRVNVSPGAYFVFHPERVDELKAVQTRYPGGATEYVRSKADERLVYAVYKVRP